MVLLIVPNTTPTAFGTSPKCVERAAFDQDYVDAFGGGREGVDGHGHRFFAVFRRSIRAQIIANIDLRNTLQEDKT